MGRKKGKQCGQFNRKALKTAWAKEYLNDAKDQVSEGRCNHYRRSVDSTCSFSREDDDGVKKGPSSRSLSQIACNSRIGQLDQLERPTPMVNQLQGLLMERRWEDRLEDRYWRRRQFMLRSNNVNMANFAENIDDSTDKSKTKNPPGWIHFYTDPEEKRVEKALSFFRAKQHCHLKRRNDSILCGRITENKSNNLFIPSLKYLCIREIARVLPVYARKLGEDTLHSIITTLPAEVVTLISMHVICTNDALIRIVGKHPHLQCLSLNGRNMNVNECNGKIFSSEAILDLVPRFVRSTHASDHSQGLSWEEIDDSQHGSWEGCIHLKRLEIRDAPELSSSALSIFLERCPSITHLCICNSFNMLTGLEFLLDPVRGILGDSLKFWKHGKVLDISCCNWLSDRLLLDFLTKLYERCMAESSGIDEKRNTCWTEFGTMDKEENREHAVTQRRIGTLPQPSLKLIRVLGCNIDIKKCNSQCTKLFGRSLLNTEIFDPESELYQHIRRI